jgi:hypothetical protein
MGTITLAEWALKVGKTLEETDRAIKLEVLTDLVYNTREDTGRLRGNWQVSEGAAKTGTLERLDKVGNTTIAQESKNITPASLTWYANNLDYAPVWNERDAIIARAQARFGQIVRLAINEVK